MENLWHIFLRILRQFIHALFMCGYYLYSLIYYWCQPLFYMQIIFLHLSNFKYCLISYILNFDGIKYILLFQLKTQTTQTKNSKQLVFIYFLEASSHNHHHNHMKFWRFYKKKSWFASRTRNIIFTNPHPHLYLNVILISQVFFIHFSPSTSSLLMRIQPIKLNENF